MEYTIVYMNRELIDGMWQFLLESDKFHVPVGLTLEQTIDKMDIVKPYYVITGWPKMELRGIAAQ